MLNYLIKDKKFLYCRIFWVTVPFVCFMGGNALLATFLIRYKSNPTRLNVDTNHEPIGNTAFPAVIFCNNLLTKTQNNFLEENLCVKQI